MTNALFTIGAVILMYAAFALLALGQERHWTDVTRGLGLSEPSPRTHVRLRGVGVLGLAGGFVLCLVGHGPAFGSVVWVMCLGLCATLVAFTLAWKPGWMRLFLKLAHS